MGQVAENKGPANVHRKLVEHWPEQDRIEWMRPAGRLGAMLGGIAKGAKSDIVLSPCLYMADILAQKALHAMDKPIVCFNHGYVPFENEINGLGHGSRWIELYKEALDNSDLVVCNSELQQRFVVEHQPSLAGKITHIELGIDPFVPIDHKDTGRIIIAVSGGTRPIKGNDTVIKACHLLRKRGIDCELRIYGDCEQGADYINGLIDPSKDFLLGQVPHEQFVEDLSECSAFIMNSRHEPFGLSALDAIEAGTPLLTSMHCGVNEVLDLQEPEIIQDCEDVDEVAWRIMYILAHPNADRIYSHLDFDKLGWDRQAAKLRSLCLSVLGG